MSDHQGDFETQRQQKAQAISAAISLFFTSSAYAVVGASSNPDKYGNKVLRCYLQNHKKVIPVNPRESQIEGLDCVAHLQDLPEDVKSLSIITPPNITEQIVKDAVKKGIQSIWMQPGAESPEAIAFCEQHHINVIAGGPCILVELRFLG